MALRLPKLGLRRLRSHANLLQIAPNESQITPMTSIIAFTIHRYIAELARLDRADAALVTLDDDSAAAIEAGRDMPREALTGLLARLAEQGPADIGLRCGSARRLAEQGVVGHAIASCRTLGAALQIAIAHGAASDPLREVRYQTRGSDWTIDLRVSPGLAAGVKRLATEEWIASFFAHLAEVTGIVRPQARIELDYGPAPGVDYARWLPAVPIFGRRRCRLVLPAALLDRQLVSYDHEMLQLILRHFAERPATHASTADRVRRHLVLGEGQPPSLAAAAADLGTRTRTLVRRLAGEGTSFGVLLDEHRRGYALALARDGRMGSKQISAALGYRSEQSFKRAFVQWTGQPLGQWRRDCESSAR